MWTVAVLALAGLVVAGLVSAAGFGDAKRNAPAGLQAITTPGFVRVASKPAPGFSLPELRDPAVTVSLAMLAGKPVLLNFWSSTCSVCVEESPAIAAAHRLLGSEVTFVGVDTLDVSRSAGLGFAAREGMTYLLLTDSSADAFDRYEAPGLPTTYFISASGKVVAENLGRISLAALVHDVRQLFGVSPR
jgi:cytochrome c biogenesis protein CcmG/thiol:disulfide interchange protein DsbE